MLWRFPAGVIFIRPDAVVRNLFFALLFVFNLGISLSFFNTLLHAPLCAKETLKRCVAECAT